MIRTGGEYRESIRDGREVWIDGERVEDVTTHPAFKPIVDVRARIYDMAHEAETQDVMTYVDPGSGERCAVGPKLPMSKDDWSAKRRAVDAVLDDIGGVVTRVGDETVGEMWSLFDGQDVLAEIDPRFSAHIRDHVQRAAVLDPFHVSANTDPKGDRSRRPQDQDPDVLLHVVRETDDGIVVRGAKFETAAAYANQAFVKPTIGDWGQDELSDYAVGFIARMDAPGIKHICRSGFAGTKPVEDYPLTNRFDEVDTLIVFDDVEIPWEDVLFYRHTRAASLHPRDAAPLQPVRVRPAPPPLRGPARRRGVRERVADRREDAPGRAREARRAGLLPGGDQRPPHRRGRARRAEPGGPADAQPGAAVHGPRVRRHGARRRGADRARPLRGPDVRHPVGRVVPRPEAGPWLEKYYRIGDIEAEERRKLLAFARDLMDSDYAGHRLTFQLFAQSPPFAHLLAVYNNYDFSGPLELVRKAADLSEHAVPARMAATGGRPRMTHRRIRPFNTRDTYPEQGLDNDLCQAVVAGNLVFIRGQVGQDLDTAESVGHGDAAAQAEQAMANIGLLLAEAGARLEDICRVTIYLTDIRYREGVYRVIGRHLKGVFPVSTGRRRVRARAARVAGRGRGDRGDPRRPGRGRMTFSLLGVDAEAGRSAASSRPPARRSPRAAWRSARASERPRPRTSPIRASAPGCSISSRRGARRRRRSTRSSAPSPTWSTASSPWSTWRAARRRSRASGRWASTRRRAGSGAVAAGNLLAGTAVPAAMVEAFEASAGSALGDRLVAALRAGLAAGGEEGPVRSAGLVLADAVPWPVADLRVDWADDPIAGAARAVGALEAAAGRLRAAGARAGGGPELRRSGRPVAAVSANVRHRH